MTNYVQGQGPTITFATHIAKHAEPEVLLGDGKHAKKGDRVTLTKGIKGDPLFVKGAVGIIGEIRQKGHVQIMVCHKTKGFMSADLKLFVAL